MFAISTSLTLRQSWLVLQSTLVFLFFSVKSQAQNADSLFQHNPLSLYFIKKDTVLLQSWFKAWSKATQDLTSAKHNDIYETVSDCYFAFFFPENPTIGYSGKNNFEKIVKTKSQKKRYWIIQNELAYSIFKGKLNLPDTSYISGRDRLPHISKADILDHYSHIIRNSSSDTIRKGEFLFNENTPDNWLFLDSLHRCQIVNFLGRENLEDNGIDSIEQRKILFLKPWLFINQLSGRTTPLHKLNNWVIEAQPEIFLIAFDSDMVNAHIFFLISDIYIGFAALNKKNQNWNLIYTGLDYFDPWD